MAEMDPNDAHGEEGVASTPGDPKSEDTSGSIVRRDIAAVILGAGLAPQIAEFARQQARLSQAFSPTLQRLVAEQARVADVITPQLLKNFELTSTARVAEILAQGTALSAWRNSLVVDDSIGRILKTQRLLDAELLSQWAHVSQSTVALTEWAALLPTSAGLRHLAAPSLKAYQSYVLALPDSPSVAQARFSLGAGHGSSALLGAEILNSPLPDSQSEEAVERVEDSVVEPWREGPVIARAELVGRLGTWDATIPDLLDGAWFDLSTSSPAALVKISTCAVEAVDRALRSAAPKELVLRWIGDASSPLIQDGSPTRAARIRYLMKERKGDVKLVEAQLKGVLAMQAELTSRLQSAKHASSGDVSLVRAYVVSVEALLFQLFMIEP